MLAADKRMANGGANRIMVIPFHMTNVAPRGMPSLPWVSAFPEINVRTYVRAEEKPGVYFFSLDAGNRLAVAAARALFHLPYYSARIGVQRQGEWVRYHSRRVGRHTACPHVVEPVPTDRRGRGSPRGCPPPPTAGFTARYGPVGSVHTAAPGSFEYFLTERYCLYTVDSTFHLRRLEIHHPPWPLQRAEAAIEVNTMAEAARLRLPPMAPELHFARRQDVVAWPLTRVA